MPPPADVAEMADLITRLGLVDEFTTRECVYELDSKSAPAETLIRLLERKALLTPYQGAKLLKGDTDGYLLGGYRLLYRIAAGSFGRVYRGDDPRTGQIVAVKVLRRKWMEDKRKVELFEREGRVGLTLRHPNIVNILAVSKDQSTGSHFIVMEFVEGGNLRDILNIRGKMSVAEGMKIIEECVAGLTFAVSRGLSHRDIKASNILLGTDGVAKLVDFGLAEINNAMQEAAAGPASGPKKGADKEEEQAVDRTVDYAGLEKATNVKQGDGRSDLYFLGHVLYEMIAGEPLMPATKDRYAKMNPRRYEMVEETLAKRAPELGIPKCVEKLIAKAVAFNPKERFQSPALFLDGIRAVRAELAGDTGGLIRASGPLTIYVVEAAPKLQDAFRDKFKKMGFRVLISADPGSAPRRYQQQPYHALLMDAGSAGTAGSEAVEAFQKVVQEAGAVRNELTAILILNDDQAAWGQPFEEGEFVRSFVRPVTMFQLTGFLREAMPELVSSSSGPPSSGQQVT